MQTMMNYQFTVRKNRPKSFTVQDVLQIAFIAVLGLWLLYQISQPYHNTTSQSQGQLTDDRISNILGRKGSAGLSKSTSGIDSDVDSGVALEEGEITRYSSEIDRVELGLKKNEEDLIKEESLTEVNVRNTLLQDDPEESDLRDGAYSFPDENRIPQHVRDEFVGDESTQLDNETRTVQSIITTDVGGLSKGILVKS